MPPSSARAIVWWRSRDDRHDIEVTATRCRATSHRDVAQRSVRPPDIVALDVQKIRRTHFLRFVCRKCVGRIFCASDRLPVKTLVIVRTRDPHRQAEALRAALGLTLRGAMVEVIVDGELLTPLAKRSAETLRSFGHAIGDRMHLDADVIEVWT